MSLDTTELEDDEYEADFEADEFDEESDEDEL